jgi:hypothetical protein
MGKLGFEYSKTKCTATGDADVASNMVTGSAVFCLWEFPFGAKSILSIDKSSFLTTIASVVPGGLDFTAAHRAQPNFNVVRYRFWSHCHAAKYSAQLSWMWIYITRESIEASVDDTNRLWDDVLQLSTSDGSSLIVV